jgi:hypothetical protein
MPFIGRAKSADLPDFLVCIVGRHRSQTAAAALKQSSGSAQVPRLLQSGALNAGQPAGRRMMQQLRVLRTNRHWQLESFLHLHRAY